MSLPINKYFKCKQIKLSNQNIKIAAELNE